MEMLQGKDCGMELATGFNLKTQIAMELVLSTASDQNLDMTGHSHHM